MTHSIIIPDELWEAADGSPMKLRNKLYLEFLGNRPQARKNSGEVRRVEVPPWGTLFFAEKISPCPLCSGTIHPTMPVVQTSWTKQTPDGLQRGGATAVHLECATRNGLEVRWSIERLVRDLRRIISGIPKRKLMRRAA